MNLRNMQHEPTSTSSAQTKRNRRYTYLSKLATDPSTVSATDPAFYFSDTAMRMRDPQLFDFYVGRHIPESERTQPFASTVSLVDRIFHSVDERAYFEQLGVDVEIFGNAPPGTNVGAVAVEDAEEEIEEFESDDEEGKQEYEDKRRRRVVQAALSRSLVVQMRGGGGGVIPQDATTNGEAMLRTSTEDADANLDRDELRKEFIRIMKEKFLDGRDQEYFDYSHVDENSEYDDFVAVGRDAEERYFDEEVGGGGVEQQQQQGGDKSPVVRSTAEWANAWNQGSVNNVEYDY
ncbi:coiled-coil domain-containing protein-domain-containing protein [Chytriomyces cf. hyalinus JEL632]|nr:coiled-coil domain-containing protein-domain-containing protein [Chytriomyces cf. hyalinus JEL632]